MQWVYMSKMQIKYIISVMYEYPARDAMEEAKKGIVYARLVKKSNEMEICRNI